MKIDKALRRDAKRNKARHAVRVQRRAIEPTLLRKVVYGTLKRPVTAFAEAGLEKHHG